MGATPNISKQSIIIHPQVAWKIGLDKNFGNLKAIDSSYCDFSQNQVF